MAAVPSEIQERAREFASFQQRARQQRLASPRQQHRVAPMPVGAPIPFGERPVTAAADLSSPRSPRVVNVAPKLRPCQPSEIFIQLPRHPQHPYWAAKQPRSPRQPPPTSPRLTVLDPVAATFRALDTTEVLAAYRRARRRAIFLDWGGTLVPIENNSPLLDTIYYKSDLPAAMHHCLQELASDPSNLLMIISGQERSCMEDVFKGLHGASLAAEHGFQFKLGSFPGVRKVGRGGWQQQLGREAEAATAACCC